MERKSIDKFAQQRAPIYEALERFRRMRIVPFDVPGHKHGRGNPELVDLLGAKCVGIDVNSMKPLDNLCHPVSVIREAEELAAEAFGASHAFLMVGGTTSAVQSMILSCCKKGDKIIMPRNVHKSVINSLVLCGAKPIYVNPDVDQRLGISLGMKVEQVKKAIEEKLGFKKTRDAFIVGAGNLGSALAKFDSFKDYGLNILAMFDNDPKKIGTIVNGKEIFDITKVGNLSDRLGVDIAILTVPREFAKGVANYLAGSGIKYIWNFTPCILDVPSEIKVWNENLIGSFLQFTNKDEVEEKK